MKRLLTCLFLVLMFCNLAQAESSLPECQGEDHMQWTNCKGTFTWPKPDEKKYVGEFKYGEMHGQGIMTFANGDNYIGEWKYGLQNGQGTLTKAEGKYVGQWKDGEYHGKGTFTFTYSGSQYVGDEYHDLGAGTFTFTSGVKYDGEWKKSMFHGQGVLTHPNGRKYAGEFKNGRFHGQGTETSSDGKEYVGQWFNGRRHGQGTYTWPAEDTYVDGKYVGKWKNDRYSGHGTITWSDGVKYVGEFKDNKKNGQGTMTWSDGAKYVGEFKDGTKNGRGNMTYPNGTKYAGEFKDDKNHGQGTLTYPDGKKYVVRWEYNIIITKKEIEVEGTELDILEGASKVVKKPKESKPSKSKKTSKLKSDPKITKTDTTPPIIEIAEQITVNDPEYVLEGKVTDKSKQIFIEVDGRLVEVKRGKFKIKGYSPVDKEISIEAIDGHGNRSKPKIVKIIIDIKDTDIAEKLEPLNPSKIRTKTSKNKVAIIIGIENYAETPKATYANLDAKYFFDYARKAFGVRKQNINLLIDDEATLGKINQVLFKWLVGKVKANQTDLIIFFAGHGLASNDGKELYFLPQDGDPDLLSIMALSRTKLFEQIIKLKPKSVTMFLDTCYSGISRDEQMLLASARPIRIVVSDEGEIPDNFTIFSATELDQISSGLKEAKNGIFSYYVMKGLEGNADSNEDKQITNGELLAYLDVNVSQKALELGRQQNPMLSGDPDQVLMRYR